MSQGRRFIQSVLRDGQPGSLRLVGADLFLEEELPLYQFVLEHHGRHRALPDARVLAENGFRLPPLEDAQPISYHMQRLQDRFVFNAVSGSLPTITAAMQAQDIEAVLETLRETLAVAGQVGRGSSASLLSDEVRAVLEDYYIATRTTGLRGMTFGWDTLDTVTQGAIDGDLIVVAGRPAAGKTGILINMAYAAWAMGKRILFVSMEMGKLQIARRWVGRHTGINPNMIRAGELSRWGLENLINGIGQIADAPGRVYLESGDFSRSVGGVESAILQFEPESLYIDAAYLLSPDGARSGFVSKWEQLSTVIGQLKQIALRYHIPVFITVQFNRNQKSKSDKAPDLGDIAGTDSIPQDASIVLGLQKAPSPYEEVRRVIRMMKSREGEERDLTINYRFNPVDFSEIPPEQLTETGAQNQTVSADLSWMV